MVGKEKKTVAQKLVSFLSKFKFKLAIIVILVVVIIAVVVLLDIFSTKKYNAQMDALYLTADKVKELNYDEKEEVKALKESLVKISDGKNYPSLRALLYLSEIEFKENNFEKALNYVNKVKELGNNTYLYQMALIEEAIILESLNRVEEAIEVYQSIWDRYSTSSLYSPKALFALARIYLDRDTDLAKATFEQLSDQFPNSEYSKLAKNILATKFN